MKSKYLRDLRTQKLYEIPADQTPRKIGRYECDIQTPAEDISISRYQARVRHDKDGTFWIEQESHKSFTWVGTEEKPYLVQIISRKVQKHSKPHQVLVGNIISMGSIQRFRLEEFAKAEEERVKRKSCDTDANIEAYPSR